MHTEHAKGIISEPVYEFESNSIIMKLHNTDNKVILRIYGHGRGWAFTKTDFISDFDEDNIYQALSSLTKSGKIRRVFRGVYDYPRYSQFLDRQLSPDFDQVAHALARKFNWRIQPSGDVALNLLGLSNQVPGRWIYVSDGPSREYVIGNHFPSI